ncbi:MAG: phosphoadenylyl-sulfate reductase [Micromonosporaceae bacterium]|nr:phosphoadenylyl-sulfate reductase [Micromonosporaceae bacterium]
MSATSAATASAAASAPAGVRYTVDELRELAARAAVQLDQAPAEKIIEWAVETFGERFCITSSFADAVLAHVASRVVPGIEVVFLDTGLHFAETLRVRDIARTSLPVTVKSVTPRLSLAEQDAEYGPRLYSRDPDQCCWLRKVEPLERALEPYDAWAAGLRRDEGPTRANTPVVGFENSRGKVKVAPLAYWTEAQVQAYIAEHNIPVNALLNQGYASVGCWPCTRRTAPGEDPRAGRWPMFDKTECGIHTA